MICFAWDGGCLKNLHRLRRRKGKKKKIPGLERWGGLAEWLRPNQVYVSSGQGQGACVGHPRNRVSSLPDGCAGSRHRPCAASPWGVNPHMTNPDGPVAANDANPQPPSPHTHTHTHTHRRGGRPRKNNLRNKRHTLLDWTFFAADSGILAFAQLHLKKESGCA